MDDAPDTPHERLRWARERAGFSDAAEFARSIGLHPTTYRAYENGQNGFSRVGPTIAKPLGVTTEWLLHGEGGAPDTPPPPRPRPILSERPPIRTTGDIDGSVAVRRVDLSYAMGDGRSLEDFPEEEAMRFDPDFLRSLTRAPVHCLFVARGDGDSMMPTLVNDDMVLIDTSQRILNMQDRIWACSLHGASMIKRLRVIGEGRIEIRSDNPAIGSREVDAEELYIVGRVIFAGRRI